MFSAEIFITGSAPQLGAWKGDAAAALKWTEGGIWTTTLNFAPGVARESLQAASSVLGLLQSAAGNK